MAFPEGKTDSGMMEISSALAGQRDSRRRWGRSRPSGGRGGARAWHPWPAARPAPTRRAVGLGGPEVTVSAAFPCLAPAGPWARGPSRNRLVFCLAASYLPEGFRTTGLARAHLTASLPGAVRPLEPSNLTRPSIVLFVHGRQRKERVRTRAGPAEGMRGGGRVRGSPPTLQAPGYAPEGQPEQGKPKAGLGCGVQGGGPGWRVRRGRAVKTEE